MNVLDRKVLVLNRNWQAIDTKSVADAMLQIFSDAATPMVIASDKVYPVSLSEWLELPVREQDDAIHTPHKVIRCPTVIVCCNYRDVPKRRPKFCLKTIAQREGETCQYTGKLLKPEDWSLDHIDPKSRGGKDVPENVVLAHKDFNNKKGNKTPEEIGVPRPKARALRPMPTSFYIKPSHPDHEIFLIQKN